MVPVARQNVENPSHKLMMARISFSTSFLLVCAKLVLAITSGSVSVFSEALHSGADLFASGVSYLSVRVSSTPPDNDHPYGHGKVESLSALFESVLIFVGAALVLAGALARLRHPQIPHSSGLRAGIALMAVSCVVNIVLSIALRRTAQRERSPAMDADGRHLAADAFTSAGVFVGLILIRTTGQGLWDPVVGCAVAVGMVITGIRLFRDAIQPLMDSRLPMAQEALILQVLNKDDRVLGYHKLRTRWSGPMREADVHVQIEDKVTLLEAHSLTEELEDKIRSCLPGIHISIHIEPFHAEMRHQREALAAAELQNYEGGKTERKEH